MRRREFIRLLGAAAAWPPLARAAAEKVYRIGVLTVSKEGKNFNEFPEIVQSANMMFDQLLWRVKALMWARANEATPKRAA
jgi:hypothetical protein